MGNDCEPTRSTACLIAGQRGLSLVEVLVAVVVLSIGVLGAVGMQAASMQSTKEVRNQAVAVALVKELAEKMRGNHAVAIDTTPAANPYLRDATLPPSAILPVPSPNCATASCTPAQMAAWDIWEWQLRLRDALPSPRVRICMDAAPFNSAGEAQWDCTASGNGDVAVIKLAWNRTDTSGLLQLTASADTGPPPLLVLPITAGSSQ